MVKVFKCAYLSLIYIFIYLEKKCYHLVLTHYVAPLELHTSDLFHTKDYKVEFFLFAFKCKSNKCQNFAINVFHISGSNICTL